MKNDKIYIIRIKYIEKQQLFGYNIKIDMILQRIYKTKVDSLIDFYYIVKECV